MTLKKINPKAILYHYFEKSPSELVLYDDELDQPIAYGSRNLVDAMVRTLDKRVTVIYYKRDIDTISFKKKILYKGSKVDTNTRLSEPHQSQP
jgi:hypothetical protein